MTNLIRYLMETPMADTHEHQPTEDEYLGGGAPDVLQDLFGHYVRHDLVTAGADPKSVEHALDANIPDIAARFEGVREAWDRCRHTGYGEATHWIARNVYGMEEITTRGIEEAFDTNTRLRRPGERLRILRETANLDHVQVDTGSWSWVPDAGCPDFFLHDIGWVMLVNGQLDLQALYTQTGVEVKAPGSFRQALEAVFDKNAPTTVAVKSQHAYSRSLAWRDRTDDEVAGPLSSAIAGAELTQDEKTCIGDWALARGAELAAHYDFPFKIHTGYLAGNNNLMLDRLRPAHLCELIISHPQTRFVLMHTAYPFNHELLALAKNFSNVHVDFCWGWAMDPMNAAGLLRGLIHCSPAHKIFAFGGDSWHPNATAAYADQARRWINRALQAEVNDGLMNEREAIRFAARIMLGNQAECFRIGDRKRSLREIAAATADSKQ